MVITGFATGFVRDRVTGVSKQVTVEHISDEALMEAFVGGNARAFERLLKRHQRPVFNFVCRLVGDRAAAEDIFQELFFRVIKAAPDYHPRARFTTWKSRSPFRLKAKPRPIRPGF